MFPSDGEARFNGKQLQLASQCAALTASERAQLEDDPCPTRDGAVVEAPLSERAPVGGRIEAALADLLCRLLFSDHWEISRNTTAAILNGSQQPISDNSLPEIVGVPGRGFDPGPDAPRIEHFAALRLPDG
jgi:hypothetical protein